MARLARLRREAFARGSAWCETDRPRRDGSSVRVHHDRLGVVVQEGIIKPGLNAGFDRRVCTGVNAHAFFPQPEMPKDTPHQKPIELVLPTWRGPQDCGKSGGVRVQPGLARSYSEGWDVPQDYGETPIGGNVCGIQLKRPTSGNGSGGLVFSPASGRSSDFSRKHRTSNE